MEPEITTAAVQVQEEEPKREPIIKDRDEYLAEPKQFYKSLGRKAGKVLKYSLLLRFALNLIVNRLNLKKTLRNSMPVVRLSLACTTFNILYHLIRRLFAKRRRSIKTKANWQYSQEMELMAACSLASLGLSTLAPSNDLRIIKVVLFSRAVTSLVTYLGDMTGMFKPLESEGPEAATRVFTTEYALACIGCAFLFFCYILHPNSMPLALKRTFDRGMAMSKDEKLGFECMRAVNELGTRRESTKSFPRWGALPTPL